MRGMQDSERFIEEMRRFFGQPEQFKKAPQYMALRRLDVLVLMGHQEDALQRIERERGNGKNAFLVLLPTGTGKTEVFLEHFRRLKAVEPKLNGLILVPTLNLRDQTLKRLELRLPAYQHSLEPRPRCPTNGFMVQTYQHMLRHYESFSPDAFDYFVVDEAHHAVAPGARAAIEHFRPQILIGVTATDERLDRKRLEDVFGSYETNLSLREAIEKGLLPPIRAFRVKTNVDLSNVRFNGTDYVQADLQRTLRVPSRDEIVADVLQKYFGQSRIPKQGVVFCVNVRHAKEMAELLTRRGLPSMAVSGEDKKAAGEALCAYQRGTIRFVTACQLLSEGWDAPHTSVVVMARPTMSKVLYVQQLGRGTRSHPGKEALYVIDVVDSHGPLNAPWSVHALFGQNLYQPWASVVTSNDPTQTEEQHEQEILLGWLHEEQRKITEIDIFTFQQKYDGYLSEEQLARELFVSTGTIKSWVRKGEITPDVIVPFGNNQLRYFAPDQVSRIRDLKRLRVHDESTQYADFFAFLEERDYTFSYKIIFLLAFLSCSNSRGEAQIEHLAGLYRGFYQDRLRQELPGDREASPYNSTEYLSDASEIIRSILANPFEKFERKRFMHHCKDLAYVAWHTSLWERFAEDVKDRDRMFKQMAEDLVKYYQTLGQLGSTAYLTTHFPNIRPFLHLETPGTVPERKVIPLSEFHPAEAYKSCLPFVPLQIAAGRFEFSGGDAPEPQEWVDVQKLGFYRRLGEGMFVTCVKGHSMEPTIPDGAWCVFRAPVEGSREGLVVLARKSGFADSETGANYTVKRYKSTKISTADAWEHSAIELHPDNRAYPVLKLTSTDEGGLAVLAEFIAVLEQTSKP